jgi:hypothetical protein
MNFIAFIIGGVLIAIIFFIICYFLPNNKDVTF